MNEVLNVKVGDKVVYTKSSYNRSECLAIVTKVTPTGRIRVDCSNYQYNKYGREMGDRSGAWSSSSSIRLATKEDIERLTISATIAKAIRLCERVNATNLTYEKALKIIELLEKNANE